MHEMSIAQSILDLVIPIAQREGAEKITAVNVEAGELRAIVPLQLTFCFGVMSENTIASGAQLNIEITPTTARCRQCDEEFVVHDYQYICPKCYSLDIEMTGGTDLRVVDIEVA